MKKVLVITYYWPPSGGAGVQRVLKTVKYLRDFGWEPVVYTALDADYPISDPSLEKDVPEGVEVIRGPIWEPYSLYKRFTGKKKDEAVYSGFLAEDKKPSLTERLSIWIRGNLFIPDARCFWIKPSVKLLTEYLKENPVDAIFSSGPPHTVHMIGRGVRLATGIPWLADFRDPWTNIDFYHQLGLSKWGDRRHRAMEQQVMNVADKLVTVSEVWANEFRELGAKDVAVARNGFDHADFERETPSLTEKFVCSHIGYLNQDRNSETLWQAFAELCDEIPAFREALTLRFVGKTDFIAFHQLEKLGLEDRVERIAYVPHSEVLDYTQGTQILMLLINNVPNVMGHIPGKTYEYVGSRRPILAVGPPEADFATVLREAGEATICNFGDKDAMKRAILTFYQQYKQGKLSGRAGDLMPFTRKKSAGQIAGVLDELTR